MISMPVIKSAEAPEVVEAIQKIEGRADKCSELLTLLDLHPSVAVWAASKTSPQQRKRV